MPARPPITDVEQKAADHANEFVSHMRLLFEHYHMEMIALVAETPEGFILTLGAASEFCVRHGVETIDGGVGTIPRPTKKEIN